MLPKPDGKWIVTNPMNNSNYLYDWYTKYLKDDQYSIFKNEYLCEFPTIKGDKKDKNEIPYVTPKTLTKWVAFDELSEINNKTKNMEDKKEMNMTGTQAVKGNDFEVGNVILKKNGFYDPFDGEVLMLCPGLAENDFAVSVTDKGVAVSLITECEDCGGLDGKTWYFDFNPYFDVEDVVCTVKDGILVLVVLYCWSNLEINEDRSAKIDTTLKVAEPRNGKE